jgi:hypothetical protein
MRPSLQALISSTGGQVVDIITLSARERVLLAASNEDSYSGSSISSSVVTERNSSFEGDEYASYAVPDDAIVDILSSI